jgi:hypothetical protein
LVTGLPIRGIAVKVRVDSVLISSVLLTISLAVWVPGNLRCAGTWREELLRETSRLWVRNYLTPIGFASLAVVLVGLIVIWQGYIKRERWAWFAMFIVVWVYAFPVYVLWVLQHLIGSPDPINWSEWFRAAVKGPGIDRDLAEDQANFLLMAFALFLPVKSFFLRSSARRGVPPPATSGAEHGAHEPRRTG